jgi:CRP-like cAMP-binding protein
MDKEKLRKYLQYIYPMPDSISYKLADEFEHSCLPKNTLLIKENISIKQSFFLESGYVRSFVYDIDGIEVTTNIYSAPGFVNDFYPFFKRLPACQNFQTITDCEFWTMTLEKVETYFHSTPEFREFGRLLILRHYDQQNERMLEMIKDTAETRYMKLLKKHPDVFQNVPLKIIASYLGITDTSLSRIRKEIIQK